MRKNSGKHRKGLTTSLWSTTLTAIAITSGCSNGEPEPVDVIRVGYIPIADCAQLFLADREGFFRDEGIKVSLEKQSGGAVILPALDAGHLHIGFSNIASLILASDADLKVRPICGGPVTDRDHVEGAVHSLMAGEVNGLHDLEGKTVAVNTTKNIVHLFVSEMLNKHQVDVGTVKFIGIPFPDMYAALLSGEVDAVATIEPFVWFAEKDGKVVNLGDYFTETLDRVQVSTYNISSEGPLTKRQVWAFKRALDRATELARTDKDKLHAAIAAYTSLDINQVSKIGLPTYDSRIDPESLREVARLLHERNWTERLYDTASLIPADD